ncbi:MAG: UDP-glucose/GDP-mannose dehydrogenase family protein [Candidatus Bathyarchaeota archaeon]|nr:UDP-glucose/GDP-mannose dehydrogenase family protein [Candidatus Bathyarchaeota archaeon]
MNKPRISVIGVGYVGLCTAVGFASKGYDVIASDVVSEKINKINEGIPPFHEPGLSELLTAVIENGSLHCLTNQTLKAVLETDITYIAVGTPSKPDGSIDLQYVKAVSQEIGNALKQKQGYHTVVVKSTVIPGTTQDVVKPILEQASQKECGAEFGLCMNPEFLRQGSAFKDSFDADRVVIGSCDKKAGDILEKLYTDFYAENLPPLIRTTLSTAELIKYASNSMLAAKISFINTIANICEKVPGSDVKVVAHAMGLDKRIGPFFLAAGLGYGGSCFPKDVKALIASSKALGYTPEFLESIENVNKTQPLHAVQLCQNKLGTLKGKRIAILGLAFKPNTDDMREARVVPIINQLLIEGATVVAYDPVAMSVAKKIFQDKIEYTDTAIDCLRNADAAILVTEWDEFKKLTPANFVKYLKQPVLIDGRRIYDPVEYSKSLQFAAIGLG